MTTSLPQLTKPAAWQKKGVKPNFAKEEKDEKTNDCINGFICFSISAFAQMSTGQGGGMMGGDWGWGTGFGFGWVFMIIIAILVILGIVHMMKRR